MKIIRTDNFGRELPEKEVMRDLDKETAVLECDKLNAAATATSPYWHLVVEDDYVPLTEEKIYGI